MLIKGMIALFDTLGFGNSPRFVCYLSTGEAYLPGHSLEDYSQNPSHTGLEDFSQVAVSKLNKDR